LLRRHHREPDIVSIRRVKAEDLGRLLVYLSRCEDCGRDLVEIEPDMYGCPACLGLLSPETLGSLD
jgi:hypothetical protein